MDFLKYVIIIKITINKNKTNLNEKNVLQKETISGTVFS